MQIVSNGLTKKVLTGTVISLFALFVVMLPRYTDTAKTWYFFLILIALAYLALNIKQVKDTSAVERVLFAAIVINFLWMAFSFYYNGEPGRGASFLWGRHFYFLFLIPLFFLFRKIDIPDRVLLLSLFFSVALSVADMTIDIYQGLNHRLQGMNPNAFGPIQLCFSGILLFLFFRKSVKWQKAVALVGFILALTAVILSQSKATWMTVPVLILFFVFYFAHSLSLVKKLVVTIGILALLSSAYLLPIVKTRINHGLSNITDYLSTDDYRHQSRRGTFGLRMELWKTGWKIFLENPVTGAGLGNFPILAKENSERYQVSQLVHGFKYVHNQYIAALATRGIPGLILLLMILFVPMYIAMSKKSLDRELGTAQFSVILISLIYIVGCLVEDHFEGKSATMFVSVFLALHLSRISAGESRHDSVSPE